jgi:hypothetical protein
MPLNLSEDAPRQSNPGKDLRAFCFRTVSSQPSGKSTKTVSRIVKTSSNFRRSSGKLPLPWTKRHGFVPTAVLKELIDGKFSFACLYTNEDVREILNSFH